MHTDHIFILRHSETGTLILDAYDSCDSKEAIATIEKCGPILSDTVEVRLNVVDDPETINPLRNFRVLKRLTIKAGSDAAATSLSKVIAACPVESLEIPPDLCSRKVFEALGKAPRLTELCVIDELNSYWRVELELADLLARSRTLAKLILVMGTLTPGALERLADLEHLRELQFNFHEELWAALPSLRKLRELKKLTIHCNGDKDEEERVDALVRPLIPADCELDMNI